ncbi:endonuclease [Candidatus Albibeggiatoa sp. nov. BB20]|uniref:endonuclease n=1 Tax=Candidatus Albibeggiatoa sp. nov. BB20 TaxID=3162723 RepID=UPI003365AA89
MTIGRLIFFIGTLAVGLTACNDNVETPSTKSPQSKVKEELHSKIDLSALPNSPSSFSGAKSKLYKKVYKGHHDKTIYCNCTFDPDKKTVDLKSCGVTPRKNAKRAGRIEAEHVFPAYQFGNFRKCWREPKTVCPAEDGKKQATGRQCCEDVDPVFSRAHNDLHNLFPAVGEVNGDRSNYNWGMISGEKRSYGECNIEVDSSIRRAEPPEYVWGNIARTMFYMSHTYGVKLSDQDVKLYTAWNKKDPVDDWELERNGIIKGIQGNRNPFIDGQTYNPKKINRFADITDADIQQAKAAEPAKAKPTKPEINSACDSSKKYCSHMANCDEAKFYLNSCGLKGLDRDGDGVPCTSLCKGTSSKPQLSCDENKKYCGDMKSCDEAKFYLASCGLKGLDRDGDGVPCSSLCK